jgi:tRNA uridine 5-carboxymethylaminomethyl modification enzyme
LTEIGHDVGLISPDRYAHYQKKDADLQTILAILRNTNVKNTPTIKAFLNRIGSPAFMGSIPAVELLKRPEIGLVDLTEMVPELKQRPLSETAVEQLEVMVKFEGYIQKQIRQAERQAKQEAIAIPEGLTYANLDGLALEARQKLAKIQPRTIGQASRISGVNPSDIAMLVLYLKRGN